MRADYAFFLAALLVPVVGTGPVDYFFKSSFMGHDFLQHWTWFTGDDPTHGCVNYVDQATALQYNLSYASDRKFVLRADSESILSPSDHRGRKSVRIQSVEAYSDAIIILDLQHMPEGCGTWPAFWSVSAAGPWPKGGEIDIIEGVNLNDENISSLHTSENCTMAQFRAMSGDVTSTDCNAFRNENQGCGVQFRNPLSYGALFNRYDGGYYAVVRTRYGGVRIWFWNRWDSDVPWEVRHPPTGDLLAGLAPRVVPTPLWGQPQAVFEFGEGCNLADHFDAHNLVFDLTFCGDWAGGAYATSGCPGTSCIDFVNGNPEAFKNAYWEINSIYVYAPTQDLLGNS